ncbi:unnamed protein product [Phytomonas sp. Hart1]|nr:unnamed protein product [Phytomonas sp. Hart1]|eukprot:CCW71162.1 unnamed protein product [Phytomonas sp. isolate Hart1]
MDRSGTGKNEGVRLYEGLPSVRKAALFEYFRTQIGDGGDQAVSLGKLTQSTIARRVRCNESLDVSAIVEEMMPIVRARMSEKTREGLFRRTAEALYGDLG